MNQIHISIVSPVYKAEGLIDELIARIIQEVSKITSHFEIILVEDGSPDKSWNEIAQNCEKDTRVKGISLSRNFGQHYAITAGLDQSKGDWVIVMDCDLQDKPEEIGRLYKKALEGFDIVLGRRDKRKDTFFKKLFSKCFYFVFTIVTGYDYDGSIANFGIFNRKVIDSISLMREKIRFFPTLVKWVGFKSTKLNIEHSKRLDGESSYNFRKLVNIALDNLLAYSDFPLWVTMKFGIGIAIISIVMAILSVIRALNNQIPMFGYASIIICICFFSGLIIIILGIIGLYLGKVFEGVKNRPIYIIKEIKN